MALDGIAEIGITREGGLYIRPCTTAFDEIFRAAMEVNWDPAERRLYGAKPREWSYGRWFQQIVAAAAQEYGVRLDITTDTRWANVPDEIRAEIEAAATRRPGIHFRDGR